jgi:spore coat protein U-like protein
MHRELLPRSVSLLVFALVSAFFSLATDACTLSAQAVVLGNYDFMSPQPLDGVGHVVVTCDAATSYRISLSPGRGSYAARTLSDGSHDLTYNLYADVNHLTVWGDGSGGSTTVSGSTPGSGASDDKTVYASAPAGQNPYEGAYSDAIVVTLEF